MKVWVLIHQYSRDGEAGYVTGVYATEAAAQAACLECVRDIVAEGCIPYYDPEADAVNDDWDEDYVVEEYELEGAA